MNGWMDGEQHIKRRERVNSGQSVPVNDRGGPHERSSTLDSLEHLLRLRLAQRPDLPPPIFPTRPLPVIDRGRGPDALQVDFWSRIMNDSPDLPFLLCILLVDWRLVGGHLLLFFLGGTKGKRKAEVVEGRSASILKLGSRREEGLFGPLRLDELASDMMG